MGINFGLKEVLEGGMVKDIIRMGIGAIIGIVVYFALTMVLKVNDIKKIIAESKK